jgi:hypothetical protein
MFSVWPAEETMEKASIKGPTSKERSFGNVIIKAIFLQRQWTQES